MKDSPMIHCDVCDSKVKESEWESHIDTAQHKEKALTEIMEDRLGKDRLSETRTETTEFLEELELDFKNKKRSRDKSDKTIL